MPERKGNTRASGRRESRRRFFQLLAGSPLLAAAFPVLPPSWQEAGLSIRKRWRNSCTRRFLNSSGMAMMSMETQTWCLSPGAFSER